MKLELLKKRGDSLVLHFLDCHYSFVNTLRRVGLQWVPTLAIEDCEIIENNSVMFDEFLAHRLGLIPLKTDRELSFQDECSSCDGIGCEDCTVVFSLDIETGNENRMVYSRDLIGEDMEDGKESARPIDENIPIVLLGPNTRISLRAVAVLGHGKEHVKWQPLVTAGIQYSPTVLIDQDKVDKETIEAAALCHKSVFSVQSNYVEVVDERDCVLCMACVDADPHGAITVKGNPNSIIARFESTGVISPKDVLLKSSEILVERLAVFYDILNQALVSEEEDGSSMYKEPEEDTSSLYREPEEEAEESSG